jgi:hypothetical protein
LLNTLKSDLNASFGLDFDIANSSSPCATADDCHSKWRFVLVGASHAKRICDVMAGLNMEATSLGTAGWFASKKNCDKLVTDLTELLESLEPDESRITVVVFCNLDKTYFQARAEDGRCIPHRQHDGVYHVDGDLVPCPVETLKYVFELLVPVFNAASNFKRLLLCPIPRYMWQGCCSDPDHAPNRAEEGFLEDMLEGLDKAKRVMRSLAFKHGMKEMKIFNAGKLLADQSLWTEDDPVHPTVAGYKLIISSLVAGLEAGLNAEAAACPSEALEGQKRESSSQLTGPDRRLHWVSANSGSGQGGNGLNWTSCSVRQWPRNRGGWRGWRGKRRGF